MTNQAEAMRKGNTIKDLTSSNVVLVKPSQDCQAKEKAMEYLNNEADFKDDEWVESWGKAIKFHCKNAIDIALFNQIKIDKSYWEQKLQEQAKEIKARLEQEANLTINKIYSTKREKSKKELQYRMAISNWIKFWEKYGVKEGKDGK